MIVRFEIKGSNFCGLRHASLLLVSGFVIRGEPERAPNTRVTYGEFAVPMYVCMYLCM